MRQKYQIFEEWPETEIEGQFQFSLFSKRKYWRIHLSEERVLPLSLKQDGDLKAFFCFYISDNELQTPFKAPYFQPYLADRSAFEEYIVSIKAYLRQNKTSSRLAFVLPAFSELQLGIRSNRCQINSVVISHYIKVDENTSFLAQMTGKGANRKRRKLRQLLNEDFQVSIVQNHEFAKNYKVLEGWRKEQNHRNIIPLEQMLKMKQSFPASYQMLKVNRYFRTIGLAIFIKEKPGIYYTYILLKDTQTKEDINLLLWNAIYEIAQSDGVSIIDMGTSMLQNGKINKGLAAYKTAIGGILTRKYAISC